jgi:ABC-type cobalamin transport system ATPase subunit
MPHSHSAAHDVLRDHTISSDLADVAISETCPDRLTNPLDESSKPDWQRVQLDTARPFRTPLTSAKA